MAEDNWQQIKKIFLDALLQNPDERRNFVRQACGSNLTLLKEVESLLSSFDGADSFMETPAVVKVADIIESETKKLKAGKRIAHYEIIQQIGAGGMGEVYLAKDQKLDRKVAIKILNEKFAQHESNLIRFVREAKAASALNHPNILTIHEIREDDSSHFIVSEYIEGKTLRETLRWSQLNLSEILDISIQIASALSAAHKARLVHRDIKPENVMIREDGFVKILDFGLAKLVEQKNKSILGLNESTPNQNETAKGIILGTVNYMSPEQAKAKRVDERTDIFSLGSVMYEMVAGRTPFEGNSVSETFANLINTEPKPLTEFAENIPEELTGIVLKMLQKNADERYQTMKDVLADLKAVLALDGKIERFTSQREKATEVLTPPTRDARQFLAQTQNIFSQQSKENKLLLHRNSTWIGAIVIMLVAVTIPLLIYLFNNQTVEVLPVMDANTNTNQPDFTQNLKFYLEIQKLRNGNEVGEPFRATGLEIFNIGDAFWMNVFVNTSGYLYLFYEGIGDKTQRNTFYLMFPTQEQQNGSPEVKSDQRIKTGGYKFTGAPGKEYIWIVWTKEFVKEFEEARKDALRSGEVQKSETAQRLSDFLQKYSGNQLEVRRYSGEKGTSLQSNSNIMVYQMELLRR